MFDNFAKLRDRVIPQAHAGGGSPSISSIIEIAVIITSANGYDFEMKLTEVFPCRESGTGEFSSFHTGSGKDGVEKSANGTTCDDGSLPANLRIDFLDGQLRARGDIDGVAFDFIMNPAGASLQPSLCVPCVDTEELQ